MEGVLDIFGIDGHQGQEDGADVVAFAFCPDGVEVVYDALGGNGGGAQAV